jgi:hypothetical protein
VKVEPVCSTSTQLHPRHRINLSVTHEIKNLKARFENQKSELRVVRKRDIDELLEDVVVLEDMLDCTIVDVSTKRSLRLYS